MTPKYLLLLRHAKSSWDDQTVSDEERTLAPRGHYAASLMAAHMHERGWLPDLVLVSMAKRTRQTFDYCAPTLNGTEVRFESGLYVFDPESVLERLRTVSETVRTLLVIGHNPALQELTLKLAGNTRSPLYASVNDKFPTAALAVLSLPGAWQEAGAAAATLTDFVRPKDLGVSGD